MSPHQEMDELAEAGMSYLTSDPEELTRFLSTTGFAPEGLRMALGSSELATAVLDYFAGNEPALLAMCANTGTSVNRFMRAWHAQNQSM